MAKASTVAPAKGATKTKTVGATAQDLGFKYGVNELADALGIEPASARVSLRNKGIEKAGRAYGWNTKAELDDVVAKLKTAPAKASAKAAAPDKAKATGKRRAA
jgi:hypothetical protein